jgi:hypothetical protein
MHWNCCLMKCLYDMTPLDIMTRYNGIEIALVVVEQIKATIFS